MFVLSGPFKNTSKVTENNCELGIYEKNKERRSEKNCHEVEEISLRP